MTLNLRAPKLYRVQPVVVFSILDHYKRRSDGQDRVVGTLLGVEEEGTNVVSIKSCFPVPHSENDDQVALEIEYHNHMLALHKKVNKNIHVVGWYSTGDSISYVSSLLHDVYKSQCREPLLLTVDVNVRKNNRLSVKGYVGNSFKIGGRMPFMARFESVNLDVHAFEGEKIGVDALINGAPDNERLDAPATILSDLDNLESSLNKLWTMLGNVTDHINQVVEGKIKGDPEVGSAISHAISAIPHLSADNFDTMFSSNIQDLLMIQYLASVTRAQLALSDKISGLL